MFKNHDEYMTQRDEALAKAETAMQEGKEEAYNAAVKEVNDLDAAWDDFARKQADLNAMRGAAKVPKAMQEGAEMNKPADQDAEYRKEFMNYVLKGTPILHNASETSTAADVGAVIPNTVLNRIIELMEANGNILAKVTRTNYKGGVSVPVSTAKPTASWVAERADVDTFAKKVESSGMVTFSYYKLKVKVAVSVIVENVTMDIFERTIAANIAEAMTRALEDAVINGTGVGQPKGILLETAPAGQTVDATGSVTFADIVKAESVLPSAYENGAEWVMHKKIFFNQIVAMTDQDGQPIARVDHGIGGKPEYRILGRTVNLTDHMPSEGGDTDPAIIGVLVDLKNYMINTNLNVTVSRYTDETTDDEVTKAIMLADGKMIDTNGLVFLTLKN